MKYILILLLMLVSCSSEMSVKEVGSGVYISGDSGSATLRRVSVDGVDCVILVGYKKGALSCDWNK